jgi:o-succinylbenzoate synthase
MHACIYPYKLEFRRPSGTSRGVLTHKETWVLLLRDDGALGIGECNMFRGLSYDDRPDYESVLNGVCEQINRGKFPEKSFLREWPSIRFGLEQAMLSLASDEPFELFPGPFTRSQAPIPINGLVWMGDEAFMRKQVREKLKEGFDCIKLKIGALDFNTELSILKEIRNEFTSDEISLRVDANGAYDPQTARRVLETLYTLDIHSIEQPIRAGQWDEMAELCEWTPVPIALDEELIGLNDPLVKREMLTHIKPQFIILKPSLVGGFAGSEEWISGAEERGIGHWVTSALESNIGLNAIAQWTYNLRPEMPQGLGTGGLFTNNFASPLKVGEGTLRLSLDKDWDLAYFSGLCT